MHTHKQPINTPLNVPLNTSNTYKQPIYTSLRRRMRVTHSDHLSRLSKGEKRHSLDR